MKSAAIGGCAGLGISDYSGQRIQTLVRFMNPESMLKHIQSLQARKSRSGPQNLLIKLYMQAGKSLAEDRTLHKLWMAEKAAVRLERLQHEAIAAVARDDAASRRTAHKHLKSLVQQLVTVGVIDSETLQFKFPPVELADAISQLRRSRLLIETDRDGHLAGGKADGWESALDWRLQGGFLDEEEPPS
jgi:hypothetical protein